MIEADFNSEIEGHFRAITPRYPEFKGQVAVVTGGAKGIGLGIVLRLAREGMRVVIADKDEQALSAVAAALTDLGGQILPFAGDVSQPDVIRDLFAAAEEKFAALHLLVNNAADLRRRRLLDEHEALLDQQLANNIRGPYLCSYYAAKIMRAAGGGSIVHVSSVGGLRAHWNGFPYDVTKGAIDAMTRAMAIDLAEYNIRVNAIAPGVTSKALGPEAKLKGNPEVLARIPLQRAGTLAELASAVAFLATTEAGYITGQVIYIDGGITAQLSPPGQGL